jgi:hypothetical protein
MENKGYVVLSAEVSQKLFKILIKLPYENVGGIIPLLVKDIEDTKKLVQVVPYASVEKTGPETSALTTEVLDKTEDVDD